MRVFVRGCAILALLLALLSPTAVQAETAVPVGGAAVVAGTNGDGLNLRSGPGYDHSVLTVIPEGSSVQVVGGPEQDRDGNHWWNVQWAGLTGWALADYLRPAGGETGSSASLQMRATFRIYAHRLGLVGQRTANGHVIQPNDSFVTLPCSCALSSNGGTEFQVLVEYRGRSLVLPVWDVGPWNVDDDYWNPPEVRKWKGLPQGVPAAQAAYFDGYNDGKDGWGRKVRSPAGMDIADGAFAALGMTQSDWVTVTFLWLVKDPPATLPTAPGGYEGIPTVRPGERPPLDPTQPRDPARYAYFPETGHNMPLFLLSAWQRGGWERYGLPVSEFFREIQVDGSVRFVQYFERAVLVYDPNTGDVDRVRIGYYAAAPASAWRPIDPFPDSDERWFFEETGHSLSHGFKAYWQANGGRDTFGLPITEEFRVDLPDGRWYVAQLFEYARLEWWPGRIGQPDEITRGRIVADLIAASGW
ncbi:SH3 domain-containing protein [Thermomicrobium sp. 4228-Ro]|uniref:SH3 domain-containing protein n=1 Tax=Thermomicrobium sp. 4228-Ro TaxID=2993937 RepID=UPI002248BD35|nr:SH3 domain-containing protein [Thermomicrobium sp. 4228-Ro]MCX2726392.1 SH3 domain-containing protein [Thermomicrobium sp. 4228-Ro]